MCLSGIVSIFKEACEYGPLKKLHLGNKAGITRLPSVSGWLVFFLSSVYVRTDGFLDLATDKP